VSASVFTRAGFNPRHYDTGIFAWTRKKEGGRFAVARLLRFVSGDYIWRVGRGVAWGDSCVLGTWPEFNLLREWQDGLPQSPYPTPKRREPSPVKLVLPYPISANRYWMSFWAKNLKRVITGVTKEAEAYKEECKWLARAAGVRTAFTCHVALNVLLIPENKVCMDLDNALKVTIDALKGIVYEDDNQVMRIVAERADADPVGGKRVEIEVLPYMMPLPLEAASEAEYMRTKTNPLLATA
jgi:crossover junction endodeoxyribonuclease RusA